MGRGSKYHGYMGQNTMGKWVKTPWVGYQNTMDRGVDIHVPWVEGSKYHGYMVDIPWVEGQNTINMGSKYHG
jgi:hypothetical protein